MDEADSYLSPGVFAGERHPGRPGVRLISVLGLAVALGCGDAASRPGAVALDTAVPVYDPSSRIRSGGGSTRRFPRHATLRSSMRLPAPGRPL